MNTLLNMYSTSNTIIITTIKRISMKKVSLLFIMTFLLFVLPLHSQETSEYGTYEYAYGFKKIRTLLAEGETGVLLDCGMYDPDMYALEKSPLRYKWFCLEPDELLVFINFLVNLETEYSLLLKNTSEAQYVDAVKVPSLGTCIVANFEKQTGFLMTKRGYPLSPWFDPKSKTIRFNYYFYHEENGEFESDGEYFTSAEFIFNSPKQILNLINKLCDLSH